MQVVNPWTSVPATGVTYQLSISTAVPVTKESPHALQVTTTGSGSGSLVGVQNPGWWGISLVNQSSFTLSLWAYSTSITSLTASLTSADRSTTYCQTTLTGITGKWSKLSSVLSVKSPVNDPHAQLTLTWTTTAASDSLFLDVVSMFPTEGWRGLPFIRSELAEMIADIHPSIVRVPGGSYVDGVNLAGRFEWNNTLYGLEHRPGHPNLWGYWGRPNKSTTLHCPMRSLHHFTHSALHFPMCAIGEDGLGIYELFSWVEKMTDVYGNPSRVVWVVNAGVSYGGETINPSQLDEWVQDAINSVEFATGASTTPYGAIRAQMGHPAPFRLDYMAIGNENCQGNGVAAYLKYYPTFYSKIKAVYPELQLIANCNQSALGKFDLYDWHSYPSPNQMYGMGHVFDHYDPRELLFVSEYAARGGDAGNGTLDAALAEAVFMNGMEVNSHVIHMASYAPLFANANSFEWQPDAVYFTSSQVYGTPSFYTQVLYANSFEGLQAPPMTVQFTAGTAMGFSASVTVGTLTSGYGQGKNAATTVFVLKLVNALADNTTLSVDMQGLPSSATFPTPSDFTVLRSPTSNRVDMNSFSNPHTVAPAHSTVSIKSAKFAVSLPAYSSSVLRVYVSLSSVGAAVSE